MEPTNKAAQLQQGRQKFALKKESLVTDKLIAIAINNFWSQEIPKGLETSVNFRFTG